MSETKLATKADLKEMYDRMLPYMGGMPEMLANKFSKGDLYSTDEKMIGQWTDGKPLYAKTFDVGALPNNSYKSVSTGLTNENVKIIKGVATASWGAINLPHIAKETAYIVELSYENHSIKVGTGTDRSSMDGSVTIYYTKTTDSAISIGSDTDYSTDEKIVGTWIDGKPIWQKTFVGTTSSNKKETDINHGIEIETPIATFGYVNKGSQYVPTGFYNGTNFFSAFCSLTSIGLRVQELYYNCPFVITIQYTKTTS